MKMRAGDAAGGAHRADTSTGFDMLSQHDLDAVHVLISRGESVAVIDDYRSAGKEEIMLGKGDGSSCGRGDGLGA